MKSLATRDPFTVGMGAILIGGLLAALVVVLSLVSFGRSTYTAELEHTAGLRVGEDVQIHGVSVGKVTGVDLDDRQVLVTFEVDQDKQLGEGTTAEVKVATLLGTHYLEIDPAGDGELADGLIPLARTSVPYNLQDVIEQGTTKLDELDPVVLARALSEASKTLDASADDVGPALEGVAELSRLVTKRSEQTSELLRAARGVTTQLSDSSDDLVALMKATNLVAAEVTSRRAAIHRLFVETTALSQALDAIVQQTDAELGPTLEDLDVAIDTLNRQDDQLRHVLEVMAPAFRYIANATGNGPYADLYSDDPALPADDVRCQSGGC